MKGHVALNQLVYLGVSFLLLLFAVSSQGAVPSTVTIQGTLESEDANPVSDDFLYRVRFFDAQINGSQLGEFPGTVTVSEGGRFSIILELPAPVLDATVLWYDLAVDTGEDGIDEGDVFPDRVRVHSVPFALLAGDSDSLGGVTAQEYLTSASVSLNAWGLEGNAASAEHFLGTTNDQSLELRVNGQRALWLIPSATSPTVIGGHPSNTVENGAAGATIAGGGWTGFDRNRVSENFGAIGGGTRNVVSGKYGVVAGGSTNIAGATYTAVGGGEEIIASGPFSKVGGGYTNEAIADYATIAGGYLNQAAGPRSFVGGGGQNVAQGSGNAIAGGDLNSASGSGSFIGAGDSNEAQGDNSAVAGGTLNQATGAATFIGGGSSNLATGENAVVVGGYNNKASGRNSCVPGGFNNEASAFGSFAIGGGAKALHDGTFVWADSSPGAIQSTVQNQFLIRARNGLRLAYDAGESKTISYGQRFRDNGILAWAKVASNGTIFQRFGVTAVEHTAASGVYTITVTDTATSAHSIVPVAIAEIDNPPDSATEVRIVSINQTAVEPYNEFEVYINNGNWNLVDNDFVFLLTGR